MKKAPLLKFLSVTLLILPLLTGCFNKKKEAELPFNEVMREAKQATLDTTFGTFHFDLALQGQDMSEEAGAKAKITFAFDRQGDRKEQELHFSGEGRFQTEAELLEGKIDLTLLDIEGRVQDELFLRLNALELNGNSDFEALKPLLQVYFGKWFKIPPGNLPESFQQFQLQQDLLQEERVLAKDIFVSTHLFDLEKYHGIKSVGPQKQKAYHYSMTLSEAGLRQYTEQVAQVLGNEAVNEQELNRATEGLKYVKEIEMWIDTQTYQVLEAKLLLSGDDLLQNATGQEVLVKVEINMSTDFNAPVSLEAPQDFLDLDALSLFTQASQLPAVQNVELEEGTLQSPQTNRPQGFDSEE